jgi:hypothetical protein
MSLFIITITGDGPDLLLDFKVSPNLPVTLGHLREEDLTECQKLGLALVNHAAHLAAHGEGTVTHVKAGEN